MSGKMGAGKSTLAKELASKGQAVVISEDDWLASLYPEQITTLDDYVLCSSQLKPQIKKLVQSILLAGTDVVMDYPANTLPQRKWLKGIFEEINAPHELIYLDISNEICLERIERRRLEQPERAKTDTKAFFDSVTKFFNAPKMSEGFTIITLYDNTSD